MLAVVIIARDEEAHIEACLSSVSGLADEVIVLLDNRTTDRTAERAQRHGARVVCEPWRGFPAQRNRG
ncbi:MAG: glycosyltransferase, partial [Chloroflexia bacterium]|nr:glycosyltransferase [Chloroflexia bacterium]